MKALAAIAAVSLAACASYPGNPPASSGLSNAKITTKEMPYRAGVGTVTAATRSGTAPYRLLITMSDGSTQVVDTDAPDFSVGSRVELTPDRVIRKL